MPKRTPSWQRFQVEIQDRYSPFILGMTQKILQQILGRWTICGTGTSDKNKTNPTNNSNLNPMVSVYVVLLGLKKMSRRWVHPGFIEGLKLGTSQKVVSTQLFSEVWAFGCVVYEMCTLRCWKMGGRHRLAARFTIWLVRLYKGWHFLPNYIGIIVNHH